MVSATLMQSIILQAQRLATHSWEYGTLSEALLEWYDPQYSVFSNDPFPNCKLPTPSVNMTTALSYAKPHISTNSTTLVDGDGAAGDPASLGVAAILIGQTESAYAAAAQRQVDHLINDVPRWANGAISHREDVAELWADFQYMAPPLLAYYAVGTNDVNLMNESIQQCNLYRDVLAVQNDSEVAGLWHHIIGPQSQDLGLWSTGNGWAAAGMSRVLATVKKSRFAEELKTESDVLRSNIKSILDGAIRVDDAEPNVSLLRNYLNDTSWFAELSGTTLLASVAYRMASLEPSAFGTDYATWADTKREAIEQHINSTGLLSPVINPLSWSDRTPATESPEAQSFAILMFAAYRSWVQKR